MNISPIMARINPNHSNNKRKTHGSTNPHFKAELNSAQTKRVLDMLKGKISEVKILKDIPDLGYELERFERKQTKRNVNKGFGIMVIPQENLSEMLSGQKGIFDTKNYKGFCIASGDKHAPIEYWNQVYDAVVAMVPISKLK